MQNTDSINKNFKSRLAIFSRSDIIKNIKNEYSNKSEMPIDLTCHIGLMVTGSSLIRSSIHMAEINQSYHGVKGLDMETHGFYYAASHSKNSAPYFVSIKSVSDFGDDTNHKLNASLRKEYALHTSSSALFHFIREYLK
ncbi:MAG TPA: hypothetical protein PLD02_13220 [Saprospiraceae bacterium]|nr:hypothetical protein [Saprospiraceae bacterium]